jgi:hypothetical protein
MSIEFGVLLEGSTITLMGGYRVDVSEEELVELGPLFRRVTGASLDPYGSAVFAHDDLSAFIGELVRAQATAEFTTPSAGALITELLRIARFARTSGKALSYFGE